MNPRIRVFLITLAFIIVSFFVGVWTERKHGFMSLPVNTELVSRVEFEPFWKVWTVLDSKFSSPTTTPDQDKVWGAIKGLVAASGDPYTVFFNPEETEMFKSEISGKFDGVGMEIGIKDDILTVISPIKGSPADRAGVLSGDKIVKINDTETFELSVDKAVRLIRGPKGTSVTITFVRKDSTGPIVKNIIRETIDIPTIETEISSISGSTTPATLGIRTAEPFIIRLFGFDEKSPTLFAESLRNFIRSGSKKLIIDLRGNPGGYLEAAVDMASWFLAPGKLVVTEDFGDGKSRQYKSRGYNTIDDSYKIVILVNGGTASASEILAGALREHDRAVLVGTKTFGKGSVQELIDITKETSLKVTVARWLTPKGTNLSKQGLTPDVIVEITSEDIKKGLDPQMLRAIEILK